MTQPFAYLNGRILPYAEAHLPLHDAGFVWGATVTDLCRTFRHRLFRLEDHLERFQQSCRLAAIPQYLTNEELTRIAQHLVEQNAAILELKQELALVMFATPGLIGHYAGLPGGANRERVATLGMHTFPLPYERYRWLFQEGARLVVPSVRQLPGACVDPRIKQRSRLHWWLAEQEAHAVDPASSALLLDQNDHVTETATANLLIVREGVVFSPRRERILGGISLRVVEELCAELGISFKENDLSVRDCQQAREAMLTNTAFCLAPVSRIQGADIACPGNVFERLLRVWSHRVGVDIRAQMGSDING